MSSFEAADVYEEHEPGDYGQDPQNDGVVYQTVGHIVKWGDHHAADAEKQQSSNTQQKRFL